MIASSVKYWDFKDFVCPPQEISNMYILIPGQKKLPRRLENIWELRNVFDVKLHTHENKRLRRIYMYLCIICICMSIYIYILHIFIIYIYIYIFIYIYIYIHIHLSFWAKAFWLNVEGWCLPYTSCLPYTHSNHWTIWSNDEMCVMACRTKWPQSSRHR